MAHQLVLLSYSGDVSTKSRSTRHRFARRLLRNLRDALACEGFPPRVRLSHDRIFVELPERADPSVLARIFGLQSYSPVERSALTDLDEIVATGETLFRERVRGRTFAVRARRVGDRSRIPVSGRDVEIALGAALLPHSAGVDLSAPEVTARLELLEDATYFLPERFRAPGGLPLGVEGRGLALVSGGFDSAVAAWLLAKRGVSLDYLFCNLGGVTHQQGTLRVTKVLADRWSYGDRPRFVAVDFGPVSLAIQERTAKRYWQVLLKRLMLRAGELVAAERRCLALVTGEAVGQVSSQTLQNLSVISRATNLAILRPLAGFNKEEIIALSREIGTHDLSAVVAEYCAMVPRRPATAASLAQVETEEAKLDPALVGRAVDARVELDLRDVDVEKLELPELETGEVPEDATVLDLRSKVEYDAWHYPGALRIDFAQAVSSYPSFDKRQHYVLYCEIGLKSAHLAEFMRRDGFDAHHFRGGLREIRRRAGSSRG